MGEIDGSDAPCLERPSLVAAAYAHSAGLLGLPVPVLCTHDARVGKCRVQLRPNAPVKDKKRRGSALVSRNQKRAQVMGQRTRPNDGGHGVLARQYALPVLLLRAMAWRASPRPSGRDVPDAHLSVLIAVGVQPLSVVLAD